MSRWIWRGRAGCNGIWRAKEMSRWIWRGFIARSFETEVCTRANVAPKCNLKILHTMTRNVKICPTIAEKTKKVGILKIEKVFVQIQPIGRFPCLVSGVNSNLKHRGLILTSMRNVRVAESYHERQRVFTAPSRRSSGARGLAQAERARGCSSSLCPAGRHGLEPRRAA